MAKHRSCRRKSHRDFGTLNLLTLHALQAMASAYNAYVFTLLIPPAVLSLINAELGPSPNFTWITISWSLGGAIFVTVGGRLSDLFGRRWFFIAGSATLVVGSIVGATGQSIPQMIACGAIYGAGSGFLEMAYGAVQVSSTSFDMGLDYT